MAQPNASMKRFANALNRHYNCSFKPNHADTLKLYNLCASVQGFTKNFADDLDGSGAFVNRVISQKAPYLTLRNPINNKGKGSSGSVGSVSNGPGGKPESAKAGFVPKFVGKGGKGSAKGKGRSNDESFAQLTLADDFYDANANKDLRRSSRHRTSEH